MEGPTPSWPAGARPYNDLDGTTRRDVIEPEKARRRNSAKRDARTNLGVGKGSLVTTDK